MTDAEKREQVRDGCFAFAMAKNEDELFAAIEIALQPILTDLEHILMFYGEAGAPFAAAAMAMTAQAMSDSDPALANLIGAIISRGTINATITRTPSPVDEVKQEE